MQLPKHQQEQLMLTVKALIAITLEILCHQADKFGVDRNEVVDLWFYLGKKCNEKNLDEVQTKHIEPILKWVQKRTKRGK